MNSPAEAQGTAGPRLDRFHAGAFALFQPAKGGFRAGLDAMLLAATVPETAHGRAADLGAGTGAVGFGAACRAPKLAVTMLEREPAVASLLRLSVDCPENLSLRQRLDVREGDLLAGRAALDAAGFPAGGYDLVLTNPPFFPADHRRSPDAARSRALSAEGPDFLTRWLRAAAALVASRGHLVAIARPDDLPETIAALSNRLGDLRVLPVFTRPGPAKRIIVSASRGSRAPLSILPGLTIFGDEGRAGETARAIADGRLHIALFEQGR